MGDDVPNVVEAAGARAVSAYRAFFDVIMQGSHARDPYWAACTRFFGWADECGLTLEAISASDVAACIRSANAASTSGASPLDLTALRSVFRHLEESGVVSLNPFQEGPERRRPVVARPNFTPPVVDGLIKTLRLPVPATTDTVDNSAIRADWAGGEAVNKEPRRSALVPELILNAGEDAIVAYRTFFDDAIWTKSTQSAYRRTIGHFLQWAESRGLELKTISEGDVQAYAEEIAARMSRRSAYVQMSAVRGLFRHLASTGVIAAKPLKERLLNTRRAKPERAAESPARPRPGPVGFPLLDLLAMLGNMEERSLQRILEDDEFALALLEQVRWPDGPECPGCGAAPAESDGAEAGPIMCSACEKPYTVLTGTMFEGSPVPIRHWFLVIRQILVPEVCLTDDALHSHLGLDLSTVVPLLRRIVEAHVQEKLPVGVELEHAIAVRDKELGNDDVGRAIMHYAELTAVRDRLVRARNEGTKVADLPPGMSLDEAIDEFEALIAEEDSYVITVEDGYLVRLKAEEIAAPIAKAGAEAVEQP
jgi:Phage integrase, N-terminal SAM-like domain/Transposase zinc-ribbon domain